METLEQRQPGGSAGDSGGLGSWLERALVAAWLAATIAALLFVAHNQLAPLQRPLTFGLVFWAWFVVFYLVIALPSALGIRLLARLSRSPRLPRATLGLAMVAFLGAALGANGPALSSLLALHGPARFRWLAPAAALFCVLALLALVLSPWRKRAAHRLLAALGAAAGLSALLPPGQAAAKIERAKAAPERPGQRLLVLGVDGADWDYIDPLIARGELPHFAALKQRGAWGTLATLTPTLSPPIWTSIVTGKAPEEHGIRHFLSSHLRGVDHVLPARLQPVALVGFPTLYAGLAKTGLVDKTLTNSSDRQVPAFWNIATAHGSPVNVVSWWATWPAEAVLGNLVSEAIHQWPPKAGRGRPQPERLTYPEGLYGDIAHHVMRPDEMTLRQARSFLYVTPQEFLSMRAREGAGIDRELTYYFSYFETTRRIALDLIARGAARQGVAPDTFVLFRIVDKMCHTSLADSELVPDRSSQIEARVRRYGRVVSAAYRAVDSALGELVSAFGEEGSVVVVSDHGFDLNRHKGQPANHKLAPEGVFIAAGPPFRPGRLEGLSVYDLLPLMLYVKGFPVADDLVEDLDERVIASDFLAHHPVRRVASFGRRAAPAATAESDAEVEEEIDHLRTLGYVD